MNLHGKPPGSLSQEELTKILKDHGEWLIRKGENKADLSYANLSYADLRSANLSYANLSYADLRSADLRSANLSSANLRSADLRSANLSYANLSYADLSSANLRSANLSYANLSYANLSYANLSTQNGLTVPWHKPDPTLPKRVAEAALKEGALDMGNWHSCDTTHCLAGWAIFLSGPLGEALEGLTSPSVAGSILMPSASHLFYSDNDAAIAWCKAQLESTEVAS